MVGDFRKLTDAQLEAQYHQCADNLECLRAINKVLIHRRSEAATELQMQVVEAIRRLSRGAPAQAETWLRQFLLSRGQARADGRALHRYRMSDDEYTAAGLALRSVETRHRMRAHETYAARLFVLYAAEWFRREARSLFRRWDDVAPATLGQVDDNTKRRLTLVGLEGWKRPLIMAPDGSREFLMTLALEGGIPANVVLDDTSHSLGGYLRSIMQRGLQDATPEFLMEVARDNRHELPTTYRHDDFVQQCAELCERLLHWRRQAQSAPHAGNPILYLDGLHPQWRADLPIYVPPGQDSGLSRLLAGLMKERLSGPAAGISARRLLMFQDGAWQPALHISADGEISRHRFPVAAMSPARVVAVPSGHLAEHAPADFAFAYPPDEDQVTWRLRPRSKLPKAWLGFAFDRAATVNLVCGGQSTGWTWPGGEAVTSDLCVFEAEAGVSDCLVLKARGSYSSTAKTLFVWVPEGWRVEGDDVECIAQPALRQPGRLYRLGAVAHIHSDDDTPYRVMPDSASPEERLVLQGKSLDLDAVDARTMFWRAPLSVMVESHGRLRPGKAGELFWRRPGDGWQAVSQALTAQGVVEVSWRDPQARVQIEKHRLCLVSAEAQIAARLERGTVAIIDLLQMPGWRLTAEAADFRLEALSETQYRVIFDSRPSFRLPLILHPPHGSAVAVQLRVRARDAVIVDGEGRAVAPGQRLDLALLRGARLLAQGAARLQITPCLPVRGEGVSLSFSDEYPLGSLRHAIEEMLADAGEQDAQIQLAFVGDTRPAVRVQRYRYPRPDNGRPLVLPGHGRAVGRMVCQPKYEYALEAVEGGYDLPEACAGPTLVYLRDGPDIVSRPLAVQSLRPAAPATGNLVAALTVADFAERQAAINSVVMGFARADANYADLEYFNVHIASLNGAPATAFDALKILGKVPAALARILIRSRETAGSEAVWALQKELPFLWLALPAEAWKTAFHAEAGYWLDQYASLEPPVALTLVRGQMLEAADRLVAREPAMAPVLAHIKVPISLTLSPPDLRTSVAAYVSRFGDHDDAAGLRMTVLPRALAVAGLGVPDDLRRFSLEDWGGLCAPGLLAAAALGRLTLKPELYGLMRRVLRDAPDYVSNTFPAFFALYEKQT